MVDSRLSSAPALRWSIPVIVGGLGLLFTRLVLKKRLLTRIRCATNVPVDSDSRPAGLMEQWYLAQPAEQKRAFVQAIRLRGTRPTIGELHAALSRVAAQHPTLLAAPSHDGKAIGSQLTNAERNSDGTINFPFVRLESCISCVTGDLDDILKDLINQPSELELSETEWKQRFETSIQWRSIRLFILEDESQSNEFTLIMRLAHIAGDGLSGMVLFRHILRELKFIQQQHSGLQTLPSTIPFESIVPITTYPSMDDLLEFRPTVGHVLQFVWNTLLRPRLPSYMQSRSSKLKKSWWNGRSLIDPNDTDSVMRIASGSSFQRSHIDTKRIDKLLEVCKKNGVTLHGLLHLACAYATAIAAMSDRSSSTGSSSSSSSSDSVTLKMGTPFGVRRLLDSTNRFNKSPTDLIGNYLALHTDFFTFGTNSQQVDSIWSRARGYLADLASGQQHDLQDIGMLGFVNPRQFIQSGIDSSWRGRSASCIVSNIGSIDTGVGASLSSDIVGLSGFELLDARFVQPAHYNHSVFMVNLIRTASSGLSMCVAYSNQVVEKKYGSLFVKVFEEVLAQVEESGECGFEELRQRYTTTAQGSVA